MKKREGEREGGREEGGREAYLNISEVDVLLTIIIEVWTSHHP